jgi:glycerol-3-phosphate dehydrogenase
MRVLLVEQRDFAWGTSSRSSKMVHGGLRYLKQGDLKLTMLSVHERDRLLEEAPGLIDPMGFLLVTYEGESPGKWTYDVGLSIYDLLALRWGHRYYSAEDFAMLAPHVSKDGLKGGFRYGDARTDDARLVFRLVQEAEVDGGVARSYTKVVGLLTGEDGLVHGVALQGPDGNVVEERGRVVVNATGAWADGLRARVGGKPRLRPLRGSHLIFPSWRFPVAQAVSFLHPIDGRPVFAFPWEGVTLVGTTDVDHREPLDREPRISPEEVAYLMAAVEWRFPSLGLGLQDVISTYSGVRPVVGTGKSDPSKESREHVIWEEDGLMTVTGGKLTTFRRIALDALRRMRRRIPEMPALDDSVPALDPVDTGLLDGVPLDDAARRRLLGRYGARAREVLAAARSDELERVPGMETLWTELRWAARSERVRHLDDLLLRRTRVGLLLPRGAAELLPRVRELCRDELGWDDERWSQEESAYRRLWAGHYSLPPAEAVPDWREMLRRAESRRQVAVSRKRHRKRLAAVFAVVGAALAWLLGRRQDRR